MMATRSRCPVMAPVLVGLTLLAPALSAQTPRDSGSPQRSGAAVVLGTDTLFLLYGRLGPFSAPDRAAHASRLIALWGPALAAGEDSIRVVEQHGTEQLMVGDEVLLTVLDSDAVASGQEPATLAAQLAVRIREAAARQPSRANLKELALDVVYTLLATGVLLGLLLLLGAASRRLTTMLSGPRMPALRIQHLELVSAARLGEVLTLVVRALKILVIATLLYIYVPLVLSFFPWTAPYSRKIVSYIITPLKAVGLGLLNYLPNLFFIAVIVVVARYLLKGIQLFFRAIEIGAVTLSGFERDWAPPTYNIVRFLVIAFAAIMIFPYLPGSGSDAFKGVSLFVGVLFSLGSSSAVSNMVAGVVLTYTRAFRLGDRVRIGDTEGDVAACTLLVTKIRTIKNVEITIPNGAVLSSQVINYTTHAANSGLILHTTVTIGYDAPWRKVHELLIAAARATDHIREDPAPFVFQTSLDDSYVSYQINAFTDRPALMADTYSLLHQNIQDHFNRGGVEIMSPHYGALRDGNRTTIPADHLPPAYQAPAFRLTQVGQPEPPRSG